MQKLWMHSLATVHCAELLALKLDIDRDFAYVTGLLHDIGKVVLIDVITTKYIGAPQRLRETPDLIVKAIEPVSHIASACTSSNIGSWLASSPTPPFLFNSLSWLRPMQENG